jgi:uncharacterized protein
MKRKIVLCAVVLFFVGLLAGGIASAQTRLIIGTGGLSGVYYPIGGAIAQIITKKVPGLEATVQTSAGGLENLRLLNLDQIDMGIVMNSDAFNAFNNLGDFQGKAIKNVRGIAVLYPQPIQIAVHANSNIKSFYDLKGKRVGVGPPGSGDENAFRSVMAAYNMSYKDLDGKKISLAEQANQFKDRHIDAMFFVGGLPASGILDVASLHAIRMIPLKGKEADAMIKKEPYFIKMMIKKGTHPGMTEDVEAIASPAYLICQEKLKTDDVYRITKAMFDNVKDIAAAHKQGEYVQLKTALDGSTLPLHPGAEKYYKEVSLMK